MTQPGQPPAEASRRPAPWGLFGLVVIGFVVVLAVAANVVYRDARYQAAMERVRQAEEYAINGPKEVPAAKVVPAAVDKPFSAEEAEREMAERGRAVREKFEADMQKRDDDNRRKMERANRDYEREKRREAAELRARQAARIP